MGTVFVFLTLLVFATTFMSKFVTRFFPEQEEPLKAYSPAPTSQGPDARVLKVIKAAIEQHRAR